MPDELLERLRRFQSDAFPQYRAQFRSLVDDGQRPLTLFIGCSDSRIVPYLLTGTGPGELFLVRNVGAFVPPYDQSHGFHGTAAAIEFAVLNLEVKRIVVCGHSHCGAIRALYGEVPAAAQNLARWLQLGREAALPVTEPGPGGTAAHGAAGDRAAARTADGLPDGARARRGRHARPARVALRHRGRRDPRLRRQPRRIRARVAGGQRGDRTLRRRQPRPGPSLALDLDASGIPSSGIDAP